MGLQVREVHDEPGGVRLMCDGGRVIEADIAVLAAGPGAGPCWRAWASNSG